MAYSRLSFLKRCQIDALNRAGYTQTQIAKEVGVHKSTICRELQRNSTRFHTAYGSYRYKADYAQCYADERRNAKRHFYKFTDEVAEFVREKLIEDWSPEQISGYGKRWGLFSISHERIYQFVIEDKRNGGELYKHLRHMHKTRRRRYGSYSKRCPISNRTMIDDRPSIVDEKVRVGDWEIDTIIGKNHKQAILSMVDRVSKFTLLKKLDAKNSEATMVALVDALDVHKSNVLTITSDNGVEFAKHELVASSLDAEFYFAHPYSSWERGLNENTNGLVRQYIKKGAEITDVTDDDLAIIAAKLNERPRKTLGYKSPNEVYFAK